MWCSVDATIVSSRHGENLARVMSRAPGNQKEGKMTEAKAMVAYCGLTCSECPAYLATQADDDAKRAETAKLWSEQYHADIKPESINCDGCVPDEGRRFSYCQVCKIRECARSKEMVNCAHCDEYACEILEGFFNMAPESKAHLDELRKSL